MNISKITNLGQLKASGYIPKSIKGEIRKNLIKKLKNKEKVFEGIIGFDETVIPDLERAFLSQHNILLLGLRGQAKTRIARLTTQLLDEFIPVVAGSEINDDPLQPISRYAVDIIAEHGDKTPVSWIHRDERYVEKLATPDVSIADLIGDVDPIKAATLKLPYSDERVIHFGLVPRAHRSIFVINELPDLQPRIQVALFNILQEGDLQIRGFKLRLPLDLQFIFTANPEDYTNRGSIVTPLKDRIESQILTHYPVDIETASEITAQEAKITDDIKSNLHIPQEIFTLIERVAFAARDSEYIDVKSGVSARMSITALENLVSASERRMLITDDTKSAMRITDFWGIIPAITGKVELIYEGEQEGAYSVALSLINQAVKQCFDEHFQDPNATARKEEKDPYGVIRSWFAGGNTIDLQNDDSDKEYLDKLKNVAGLEKFIGGFNFHENDKPFYMELVLHGLATYNVISKNIFNISQQFADPLADILEDLN